MHWNKCRGWFFVWFVLAKLQGKLDKIFPPVMPSPPAMPAPLPRPPVVTPPVVDPGTNGASWG